MDKNGGESTRFNPTAHMILFALKKAENPGFSDREVCQLVKINPENVYNWQRKYGTFFQNWLEEMIDNHAPDSEAEILKAVGMIKASQGEYQFWRDMAKTKGVIKEDQKPLNLTINTDFSFIEVGDNFEDARARLLQMVLGVGKSTRTGVASPVVIEHQGSDPSPGDRTSGVQEESVEMADALVLDRGSSGT